MKKVYVKPEVSIESFVLNQNIANCESGFNTPSGYTNHYDGYSCTFQYGDAVYFLEGGNCNNIVVGDEFFCYQAPSANLAVFGS